MTTATRPAADPARKPAPLSDDELRRIDAYWRAANYLSVGQIYLLDNPLLREPLRPEHVKPRLLGHWGTTPGPEPALRAPEPGDRRARPGRDLRRSGPGTAGPALVANTWLEGTYSEVYPAITPGRDGHAPAVPPVLVPRRHPQPRRAGDARVDPRGRRAGLLAVARLRRRLRQPRPARGRCVVGDGEAETGPLATSWHSNKFLDPVGDGAVLPILHLNGYKIANPTVLARIPRRRAGPRCSTGYGYKPYLVAGDDPADGAPAARRDARHGASTRSPTIQRGGPRRTASTERPRWPMIVLRTPKGWTGPKRGRRHAGRGHLARPPGAARRRPRRTPSTWRELEDVAAQSTGPRSCSTTTARPRPELAELAARRRPADEREPARQRRRAPARPRAAGLPRLRASRCRRPARRRPRRPGCSAAGCAT